MEAQKLIDFVARHGTRQFGITLLDRRLKSRYGLGYEDMPDTSERCYYVDAIEELVIGAVQDGPADMDTKAFVRELTILLDKACDPQRLMDEL